MDGSTQEKLAGAIMAASVAWRTLIDVAVTSDPTFAGAALAACPLTVEELQRVLDGLEDWGDLVIAGLHRFGGGRMTA